jgi:subtilisin family serine protease
VQAVALHDSGYTGAGVLVCLLDAGFNFHDTHEALAGQTIAPGRRRDFVEGDTVVTEPAFFTLDHGTWVMGVIAGDLPGKYLGSAYGAEFALARTENNDGDFEKPVEMLYWGMGAEWADSLGADLISSSLGYFQFDDGIGDYTYADMDGHTTDISRAAEIAAAKGILVVNAVGNEGQSAWRHLIAPADVHGDSLIAVGAVSTSGAPAAFTSVGPSADGRIKPDLAASGIAVPIVNTNGNPTSYSSNSGTSLSTPIVSGLAACLLQARPGWTPQQVIRALRETASRAFQPDNVSGYGIPNARAALEWSPDGPNYHPPGSVGVTLAGPNPWSPGSGALVVTFALGGAVLYPSPARLAVFDAGGRRVRSLWSGTLLPGRAERTFWDGLDQSGRPLRSAVFWVAVEAAGDVAAQRVVLLR